MLTITSFELRSLKIIYWPFGSVLSMLILGAVAFAKSNVASLKMVPGEIYTSPSHWFLTSTY